MLRYIKLPFEDSCPSALRYDLAKYESSKISESYMQLKELSDKGVLFSQSEFIPGTDCEKIDFTPPKADFEVIYTGKKPLFASEVIRAVDNGKAECVTACMSPSDPVKVADFDILYSEYERVAKEIFKRKTGKIDGKVFTFAPFSLPRYTDKKGFVHLSRDFSLDIFEKTDLSADEQIKKKTIECAFLANL